jgi:hypothetical protein
LALAATVGNIVYTSRHVLQAQNGM